MERSGLYLQDDFSRVARFPNSMGNFETTMWRDRTSLEVKGTDLATADTAHALPSPQDFGITASSSSTGVHDPQSNRIQSANRNPLSLQTSSAARPSRPSGEIRRKVFLAQFDPETMTPIPTATAYLKLKPEQCAVEDVAKITKEYLNVEEDLILMDTNGFEITDNPGTRGKSVTVTKTYIVEI